MAYLRNLGNSLIFLWFSAGHTRCGASSHSCTPSLAIRSESPGGTLLANHASGRRCVLELPQPLNYKVLVRLKDTGLVCNVFRELLELGVVHLKVFLHCPEVQT